MNILIVDDEIIQHTEIKDIVERIIPGNTYYDAFNFSQAIECFEKHPVDLVFLDVNMPGKNGLLLARELKKLRKEINIVMVTAYEKFALDALRLFVSGYIVKPVQEKDMREVLSNLRTPIKDNLENDGRLKIRCFGNFDAFGRDGIPIRFKRKKSRELLAYLVCLKGSSATKGEIFTVLFPEACSDKKNDTYLRQITLSLKNDLTDAGYPDVLIRSKDSYAVNIAKLSCDYYDHLDNGGDAFKGEFMNQYSWAEEYIYSLENY